MQATNTITKASKNGAVDVDSLISRHCTFAPPASPEQFAKNQQDKRLEDARSNLDARARLSSGARLSFRSAMALVKPQSIAKMATKMARPDLFFGSRHVAPIDTDNPMFEPNDHDSTANATWDFAQAIHNDDPTQACAKHCQAMQRVTLFAEHDADNLDDDAQQVKDIDSMLQQLMAGFKEDDFQSLVLRVAASFNAEEVVRSILTSCPASKPSTTNHHVEAFKVSCKKGHLEIVKMLMLDPRVTLEEDWDVKILRAAADIGHCDVVDWLVQDNRVNPGFDRAFALRYYCLAGDTRRARELLSNPQFECASSMLVDASHNGRAQIVELLLCDPRVDPSAHDNQAVTVASSRGHAQVVKLLLDDSRVDPSSDAIFAIKHSSRNGHEEVVRLLLDDPRVNPASSNNFAIQWASHEGHDNVVKLLLADHRVDPSAHDNCVFHYACQMGRVAVVKLLLADPRVDPAADANWAIQLCSRHGHEVLVKLLMADPRVDPSAENNYAIQVSTVRGHAAVVKLLLADPRVDPSVDDNFAIQWASGNGHEEVVKLLLADPRIDPSANDNRAIQLACQHGCQAVAKLLLADPRVDPSAGQPSALGYGIRGGHTGIVKLLLTHAKTVITREALVDADEGDHDSIIVVLLENPQVILSLFEGDTIVSKPNGVLTKALRRQQNRSAWALLLAVERTEGATVRMSDVLRDVIELFARFDVVRQTDWTGADPSID
jgi:ankyrin repeat protein